MIRTLLADGILGDRQAVTAVEYGVIAALVVAIGLSTMNALGLVLDQNVGRVAGVLG